MLSSLLDRHLNELLYNVGIYIAVVLCWPLYQPFIHGRRRGGLYQGQGM